MDDPVGATGDFLTGVGDGMANGFNSLMGTDGDQAG
jgi:hypothetical protein